MTIALEVLSKAYTLYLHLMSSLKKKLKTLLYYSKTLNTRLKKRRVLKKEGLKSNSILKLNILLSPRPDWEKRIREGFANTKHNIHFDILSKENIQKNNLVIPLTIKDLKVLNENRSLISNNLIPIPDNHVIDLCNNKIVFYQWLDQNGFKNIYPKQAKKGSCPYILKKKITEWGYGSEIVYNKDDESRFKQMIDSDDFFIQEIIPGKKEFATHILFIDNKIISTLTLKHVYNNRIHIRGKEDISYSIIKSCPYLSLFASILQAMKFEGICCVDYIVSKGKLYIFEINPRVGGSLSEFLFSFLNNLDQSNITC